MSPSARRMAATRSSRGDRVLIVEDDPRSRPSCSTRARERVQGRGRRRGRGCCRWPGASGPTPSCSTSACRTWTAGPARPAEAHPETRHIPVHVISADDAQRGMGWGAIAFTKKPVEPASPGRSLDRSRASSAARCKPSRGRGRQSHRNNVGD